MEASPHQAAGPVAVDLLPAKVGARATASAPAGLAHTHGYMASDAKSHPHIEESVGLEMGQERTTYVLCVFG